MKKFWQKNKEKLAKRKVQAIVLLVISIIVGSIFYYFNQTGVMPQQAINFLDNVALPSAGQKVLIFSPHPDDETLGAGGYIAESVKKGAIVKIILVTDGNKHGLKDQRYSEFRKATGILGVPESNLVYLNYSDGKLNKSDQAEITLKFKENITLENPDIIIYPNPVDQHPDHADTGELVSSIIRAEGKQIFFINF